MAQQRQAQDKLMLRLPDGWRPFIKIRAAEARRSMSAEIVHQLGRAYGPAITTTGELSQGNPAAATDRTDD